MYEGLKDNKNAEKWTEDNVTSLLSDILQDIEENETYYIGIALKSKGLSRQKWDYLQTKYKDNATILDTIKKIENATETNLITAALQGRVKETMAIFILKAKYGCIDKQVTEVEHKGSININLTMPDEIADID